MSFKCFISALLFGAALFQGCSLVDEDLSECGTDFDMDYQLTLVTNITTELETELSLEANTEIKGMLKDFLLNVFTDFAHDVDLSFYDTEPPMNRLNHMSEIMDGSESSYRLYLPGRKYRHTAVANLLNNGSVELLDDQQCQTGRVVQKEQDGVAQPHKTGLFTARRDLDVLANLGQHFDVRLYMANAASSLVLDLSDAPNVKDLSVSVSGFATEFHVSDSTYVFPEKRLVVGTTRMDDPEAHRACFVSVHFPSPSLEDSKLIIDDGGQSAGLSTVPLWGWTIHATMADGTITESVLEMYNPLLAGHIKVLTAVMSEEGGVISTSDSAVGVSVTLDWNSAGGYNSDL